MPEASLEDRREREQPSARQAPTPAAGAPPARLLALQSGIGNAAMERLARAQSPRRLDRMTFTRFSGWSALTNWTYNATERRMMQLEADLTALIARAEPWPTLKAAVKSANKVLAESRAATLDTAGYTDHEDTLTDAIKRLRGSRARAWDQRADWLREAAAQVPRDPAAAGYNAANEQAQLTATVTRILTGVPADEQQARVEELRQQALSFHRFSADGSGHVRDLVYTALAPFDQSTTALVAVHPAGFDVAGPVVGQAGGRAQIPRLQQLLTIAGGDWTRVAPLAEVAAGNATYFKRLYDQVLIFAGARAAAYAAQPLPVRNQPPSIVGLRVGYNAAHIRHFLERHTYEWFNFGGIDTVQGFWPVGTTSDNITAYVEEALQILHPPGGPPPPPPLPPRPPMIPIPQFAIPSGFTVMVGIGYGPGGVIVVGQFFPRAGAGGVVELSDVEMRAIRQVLGV